MRKFLLTILIYLLIIGSIVFGINWLYLHRVYPTREIAKFSYVPYGIQICNLGSSHGVHAYYYKDLEKTYICYNFALDSQWITDDRRILEYYLDRLDNNAVAIIDISYFVCYGPPESEIDTFKARNKRYYSFLPPQYIKNYDLYTDLIEVKLESICVDLEEFIKVFRIPQEPLYKDNKSYYDIYRTVDIDRLEEDVKASSERHLFGQMRNKEGKLIVNHENIQALYETIQMCKKHNVTPILVTCPYLKEYKEAIAESDPGFFDEFYTWINQFSIETDAKYYDYSSDRRFCEDYSLFYNGDHLNTFGGRKFTNILYEEVICKLL